MNLLFVGGGNMATALIGGLLSSKASIAHLHILEPELKAQETLKSRFNAEMRSNGIEFTVSATECPETLLNAKAVTWSVLAVKPQQMQEACQSAAPAFRAVLSHSMLLSIAAGISIDAIHRWCGNSHIVRAMPNTPALVAQGITGLFAHPSVSSAARAQAQALMNAVGKTVWIDQESLMDAVTALSGSGPAYVFRFIEALTEAGTALGLTSSQSEQLAIETMKGAISLLESSREAPAVLRAKVTSKGGTTAAALASLEQDQFMTIVAKALQAARDRGHDLSNEFK